MTSPAPQHAPTPPADLLQSPLDIAPSSSVFICHTLRCGSTLLCDALSNTGVAGYAEEYFPERCADGTVFVSTGAALKDPEIWECDWTRAAFEDCLVRVLKSGTTPNGVFAAKVKWANMPYLSELLDPSMGSDGRSLAERLNAELPGLRYVWITRRDKLRQAVSLIKARQSQQWKATAAHPQESGPIVYSFYLLDEALRRIVDEECAWEEYFTEAGITPVTVVYEDLVRDYESTVRQLLGLLQIDLPADYVFPAPGVQKQADTVSEDWLQRYRDDARSRRTVRTAANLPGLILRRHLRETYITPRLRSGVRQMWERGQHAGRRLIKPVTSVSQHRSAGLLGAGRVEAAPAVKALLDLPSGHPHAPRDAASDTLKAA